MNTSDSTARLARMQSRGLENAFAFGRLATSAFERLTRQNYAVMGDVVDYTLAQIRIPTQHTDPRSALEAQAARTRELAERARVRADEYVAIAGEVREMVGGAMNHPVRAAAPAAPAAASAAPAPTPAPVPTPSPRRSVAKPAVAKPAVAKPAVAKPAVAKPAVAKPEQAPADASADAGGTPIILPGDSPKAAVKKTAAAAASTTSGAKAPAKPAAKRATSKRVAVAAKPATPRGAGGARAGAKRTGRGAKG